MTRANTEHLAMIAVALSGLTWGIYWIPLRALDAAGVTGTWAVVLFYALPTCLLLPLAAFRLRYIRQAGWGLHASGLLAGTALVLYAGALVFTDVVRALLFFYLTPLWSTLLARAVLKEAITPIRWVTIGLALAGLLLILRIGTGFHLSLSAGDWMGLASGLVWAMAAVTIKSDGKGAAVDVTLAYFFWGTVAALVLTALPGAGTQTIPNLPTILPVLPWFLPFALGLILLPALAVMWGARVLSPGPVAILFMTEISAGTITAALWAGEPFGWREAAGLLLISAAGALEPVLSLRRSDVP